MTLRSLSLPLAALVLSLAGCVADASTEVASTGAPLVAAPAAAPGPHALVVQDGGPAIVIERGLDGSLAQGELTLLAPEWPAVVRRDAHPSMHKADAERWQGRTVRLHGPNGAVCEGVVEGLEVRARVNMLDDGSEPEATEDDDGIDRDRAEPARPRVRDWNALATQAWTLAPDTGSVDLVGRLRITRGDCTDALWAQPVEGSSPVTAAAEPASPALLAQVLAAVRSSEEYLDSQKSYDEYRAEAEDEEVTGWPARWEDHEPQTPTAQVIAHPGGETFVVSTMQAGEVCGSFGAEITQLWQLRDGVLELVPSTTVLTPGHLPVGAVDLDGDGHVELLMPHGYLRPSPEGGFEEGDSSEIPDNLGCSC